MAVKVFLDTAFAIALSVENDLFHAQAIALAEQLEATETRLVTTRVVMLEIGNARAFQLYHERPDKEWGLVDCVSFVVMRDKGILGALTTDEHYQQAGFRVLLRELPEA